MILALIIIGSLLAGLTIGVLILLTAPWWEPWLDRPYRWLEGWYARHVDPEEPR